MCSGPDVEVLLRKACRPCSLAVGHKKGNYFKESTWNMVFNYKHPGVLHDFIQFVSSVTKKPYASPLRIFGDERHNFT